MRLTPTADPRLEPTGLNALRVRSGARDPGALVPWETKLLIALVAIAINAVIYLVPNHFVLRPLVELPLTRVDTMVPFVPLTFWVYFSDYLLVASAFMLTRTWAEVRRFARAYFALVTTGMVVHFLWPTAFPREAFPVVGDDFTARALLVLRQIDLPTSCMPSMHVAGSYLAAFSLWRHRPVFFWTWTAWATAVAISTLTLKQHYAVDVVAGALMAGAFWAALFWASAARERQPSGSTVASTSR